MNEFKKAGVTHMDGNFLKKHLKRNLPQFGVYSVKARKNLAGRWTVFFVNDPSTPAEHALVEAEIAKANTAWLEHSETWRLGVKN